MHERFWTLASRRFAGEITEDEQQEWEAMLAANPDWKQDHEALQQLWRMEDQEDHTDTEGAYQKVRGRIQTTQAATHLRRLAPWRYAAAAALLAGLFAGLWWYEQPGRQATTGWQQAATPKGTRTKLTLPDGSTVWLNADSKLRYPKTFDAGHREVLLEGEAFFDVVKNPQMPFLVNTKQGTIRVLGTSFNVNAYPEKEVMETALVTGRVAITKTNAAAGEAPFLLSPGEQATYVAKTNTFVRRRVDTRLYTSWKDGKLRFDNEPFASVATKLERWYGMTIHVQTKGMQQERLTATIEKQTLEEVLELINLTTPIHYRIHEKEVFISERAK